MDALNFSKEIKKAWALFDRLNLGRASIWPESLPVDTVFRTVALTPESSYSEIYRAGLARSSYNFLLKDYSFFQFSWETKEMWRMAYFPNPWISGAAEAQRTVEQWEALEAMGDLSHEETSDLIADLPFSGANPSIRFEYARPQYKEVKHPAAHFHIGRNTDNRWPCAVLLGPLAFSMIVAKQYYSDAWLLHSSFNGASKDGCLDLQFISNLQSSQAVPDFTLSERQLLHLGRNIAAAAAGGPRRGKRRKRRR